MLYTMSAGELNRSSNAHVDDSIDRINSYALETDANLCRGNQGHLIQFNNFLFQLYFRIGGVYGRSFEIFCYAPLLVGDSEE